LPIFVVFGATGLQGSAVVRSLAATGKWRVRGVTRDATSKTAQALGAKWPSLVEMVSANWNSRSDMERVFRGAYGAFIVTLNNLNEFGKDGKLITEFEQGKAIADAAAAAHVSQCIFSSLADTDTMSNHKYSVPPFVEKYRIEQYIRRDLKDSLPAAFVYAGGYFQNFMGYYPTKWNAEGTELVFYGACPGDVQFPMVDIEDTGKVVTTILADFDAWKGQIAYIGINMSFDEFMAAMKKVTGISVRYVRVPLSELPKTPTGAMWECISEFGYWDANETTMLENYKRLPKLTTAEMWLNNSGFVGPPKPSTTTTTTKSASSSSASSSATSTEETH